MRIVVTFGCSAASASSRSPVPSVEPSSTKIASYSSAGSDCREQRGDARVDRRARVVDRDDHADLRGRHGRQRRGRRTGPAAGLPSGACRRRRRTRAGGGGSSSASGSWPSWSSRARSSPPPGGRATSRTPTSSSAPSPRPPPRPRPRRRRPRRTPTRPSSGPSTATRGPPPLPPRAVVAAAAVPPRAGASTPASCSSSRRSSAARRSTSSTTTRSWSPSPRTTGACCWRRRFGSLAAASPAYGGGVVYAVILERAPRAGGPASWPSARRTAGRSGPSALPSRAESSPLLDRRPAVLRHRERDRLRAARRRTARRCGGPRRPGRSRAASR